jgi:hypothetical protein
VHSYRRKFDSRRQLAQQLGLAQTRLTDDEDRGCATGIDLWEQGRHCCELNAAANEHSALS